MSAAPCKVPASFGILTMVRRRERFMTGSSELELPGESGRAKVLTRDTETPHSAAASGFPGSADLFTDGREHQEHSEQD